MNTMSSSRCRSASSIFHHAAAELDDRDLVAELANPAEGLDQHVGLLDGSFLSRIGQRQSPQNSNAAEQLRRGMGNMPF